MDPEASEKTFLLGADYYSKGALRPALEELLKAVELNPGNPDAHNLLGILFLRQAAESEDMVSRASCVRGAEARLELDEVDQKFRDAEAQFRTATSIKPTYSEAWNNLAVVAIHFARWDEAIDASLKALSNIVYAETWAAQGNLGWAYFQKGDVVRAEKELREALFANPKFCVGLYRLARIFAERQQLDLASEQLARLTTENCPIQEAYALAGMVALKQAASSKDPAATATASDAFRRCIELAPKSCVAQQCRIAQ